MQPYHAPSHTGPVSDPEAFAQRIDSATRTLFGTAEPGLAVRALTQQLRQDCLRLRESGLAPTPAIAIVGLTAQGKS